MEQVLHFLSDRNRPFTINDIVQGLNQQVSKSEIVSSLNKLVGKNKIIEKNCGKQKIYCIAQKSSLPLKDVSTNVLDMERQSNTIDLKLKEVIKELEKKTAQLNELEGVLTKAEILEKKENLEMDIKEIQSKLEAFGDQDDETLDKEKIEKGYGAVFKEYNKRKRLCTDMIEAILENYPKSKKTFLQEVGIETDEDVGFKIKVSLK